MNSEDILQYLETYRTRATYGAVGELLGIPAIGVASRLGDIRPRASWVVSAKTGLPSGYPAEQCHSELLSNNRIIRKGHELAKLMGIEWTPPIKPAKQKQSSSRLVKSNPSVKPAELLSIEPRQGETVLMGVDLAWLSERNGSGIAIGVLTPAGLTVKTIYSAIIGIEQVKDIINSQSSLSGLAIDAPLIIPNATGNRECEKALNAVYSSRWAGCHPSNLERYPNSASLALAEWLVSKGFNHLGQPRTDLWQIECYPHPAIIELFDLDKRLAYKKGTADERRAGQIEFARLINQLQSNSNLPLVFDTSVQSYFDIEAISRLGGQALKDNEDGLDAVLCLYIAALYASGSAMQCFGNTSTGYIVVPR